LNRPSHHMIQTTPQSTTQLTPPRTTPRTTQRISGTLRLSKPRPANAVDDASRHVDLTSPTHSGEAKMPHELDEQVGMTGGVTSSMVQQGARDLKRGLQDTSRAVESNAAYDRLKSS
jgi:hypothetical protein